MFTLKRVNYDPKLKTLVKNNKRFDFEKHIYADKFLEVNKNKDIELTKRITSLRDKQKAIRDKLM
jgi:hypothetical protein